MPKGKRRVKEIKPKTKASGDGKLPDVQVLHDMFSILSGSKSANIDIVIPKIVEVRDMIHGLYRILKVFSRLPTKVEAFPDMKIISEEIDKYAEELSEAYDLVKEVEGKIVFNEMTTETLSGMDQEKVHTMYKTIKKTTEMKTLIISSGNLHKYGLFISDKNKLDDKFIISDPGIHLQPLAFTTLNLKSIWGVDASSPSAKQMVLSILHHVYVTGFAINKIITSPDIDVKKFCNAVVSRLAGLRTQIPNCNMAFDVIENSIGMMEANFGKYYRSSQEADNVNVILESFVIDIANDSNHSNEVTMQFRLLMKKLGKLQSKNTAMDNKFTKIFKDLGKSLDIGINSDSEEKKKKSPPNSEDSVDQ
jgi:hypothetical protein